MTIDKFSGEYSFLSNFYHLEFSAFGGIWPTVEHAYQAMKTTNGADRNSIRLLDTPQEAKRRGRSLELRPDWEEIKIPVMRTCLRGKFLSPTKRLNRKALIATGDQVLIEGNTWGDTFWGVCNGEGTNYLGLLLMEIRQEAVIYSKIMGEI